MGEVWKVPCTVEIFTQVVTSCEKERQYKNALKVYAAMADAGIKYYEIGVLDGALKRVLKVAKNIAEIDISLIDLFDV